MGLARELTMGTRRRRTAKNPATANLGRIVSLPETTLAELEKAVDAVNRSPRALTAREAAVLTDAMRRIAWLKAHAAPTE
ncbi:hypothetical protein AB0395_22260 [Streptosporangium sp. NPDC051023]|uniref:hypothetical protein n=1 Tax=Streptosporangium sp. NPDC051023 TaxID=3155410 RepID=UPI00344BDCE8